MFSDSTFALLTQHGKEQIIAPLLLERCQTILQHARGFDTDTLGTFSGEIERTLSPLECARRKAELAIALTGCDAGLGSEGSFFPDPIGIGTVAEELIYCRHAQQDWQVIGRYATSVDVRQCDCVAVEELLQFVRAAPPDQGLVMQCEDRVAKGLHGEQQVLKIITQWFGNSGFDCVNISYDLRAHQCPARRENIKKAAVNLIDRLLNACPECSKPGYWPDESEPGLPCELCAAPTQLTKAHLAVCDCCGHSTTVAVKQKTAAARFCQFCNP